MFNREQNHKTNFNPQSLLTNISNGGFHKWNGETLKWVDEIMNGRPHIDGNPLCDFIYPVKTITDPVEIKKLEQPYRMENISSPANDNEFFDDDELFELVA